MTTLTLALSNHLLQLLSSVLYQTVVPTVIVYCAHGLRYAISGGIGRVKSLLYGTPRKGDAADKKQDLENDKKRGAQKEGMGRGVLLPVPAVGMLVPPKVLPGMAVPPSSHGVSVMVPGQTSPWPNAPHSSPPPPPLSPVAGSVSSLAAPIREPGFPNTPHLHGRYHAVRARGGTWYIPCASPPSEQQQQEVNELQPAGSEPQTQTQTHKEEVPMASAWREVAAAAEDAAEAVEKADRSAKEVVEAADGLRGIMGGVPKEAQAGEEARSVRGRSKGKSGDRNEGESLKKIEARGEAGLEVGADSGGAIGEGDGSGAEDEDGDGDGPARLE